MENNKRIQNSTRNFCSPAIDTQSSFEVVSCMLGYLVVIADFCAHLQSHFGATPSKDTRCAIHSKSSSRSGH